MNKGFIAQTARDYDMSIEDVERIYDKYPDDFYNQLEIFIFNRAK